MNIIGKSNNGFLVDITGEELAKLQGFHGTYDNGFKGGIGAIVPISQMFEDATEILESHRVAADCAKKLRATAEKFASYFEKGEK